jgi:Arc/MetJ family transcription regulator
VCGILCGMRTTLDLDDELMRALLERHPGSSKTQAVEHAIREYLAADAYARIRALRGKLEIEDASIELRRIDRHT